MIELLSNRDGLVHYYIHIAHIVVYIPAVTINLDCDLLYTLYVLYINSDFSTSLQDQCVKVIADSMTVLEDVELLPLPSKFKKRVELLMIV